MAHHHPQPELLVEYSAGALAIGQAACISAHLSYCAECRKTTEQLQTVGSSLMERLQPEPVAEAVLESVLARLDDPAPLSYQSPAASDQLPGLLERIINGDFSELVWRRVTSAVSISYLATGDREHEFALYRIAAGGSIPHHRHGGSEMTLVLEGGFSDSSGVYHPGDFVYREGSESHAPTAIDDGECIVLAVLDAPLKFTQWRYRWMNPFLQLRAG